MSDILSRLLDIQLQKLDDIYKRFNEVTFPIELRGEDINKNEIHKTLRYVVYGEKA